MEVNHKVKKILIIILIANLAVALAKIFLGTIIDSTSVTADGYHSLSDALSNVAGLIGIYLSMKPIDKGHPYGHKKYENITGLLMGGLLLIFSFNIAKSALYKIIQGANTIPLITTESLFVIIITLIINIFVATYEHKQGKKLNSDILLADALHTRSDILVTLSVLIALISIHFGAPPIIDPLLSIIVVIFILFSAFNIVKRTSSVLVDSAAIEVKLINDVAISFKEVIDVHEIRSRRSGNDIFVDMHICVNPLMTISEAHDLEHSIEEKLQKTIHPNIQILIHIEPVDFHHKNYIITNHS